jgi:hypothetical protein
MRANGFVFESAMSIMRKDANKELVFAHPDDRGATFLRNVGSYKSNTA